MNPILARILTALAAAALFVGLVYVVLLTANVAEPAATTTQGATPRRLWATTVVLLALLSVIAGGLALARPTSLFGTALGRYAVIVTGILGAVNGGLVLAVATGGPGTGNGVVGGAAALVLGLIALAFGGLAVARARRVRQG